MGTLEICLTFALLTVAFIECVNCAKTQAECDPTQTKLEGDKCVSPRGGWCFSESPKQDCQSGMMCVLKGDPEKACTAENLKASAKQNTAAVEEAGANLFGQILGGSDPDKKQTGGINLFQDLEKTMSSMICVCKGSKSVVVSVGLLILGVIIGIFIY